MQHKDPAKRRAWNQAYYLAHQEKKLLLRLRAGHTGQGARVTMGRELSRMRDRRIGKWVIRRDGLVHGGGAGYRLEIPPENAHDPQTSSPSSPPPDMAPREDGEDGDNKTGPHPRSKPKPCWECNRPGLFQCDGPSPTGKDDCNRYLCAFHRIPAGAGVDYCRQHTISMKLL